MSENAASSSENVVSPRQMEDDVQQEEFAGDSDDEDGIFIDKDIYIPPPPSKRTEISSNEPRLIITKIENENFKSYADKIEIGPFHKCFSAIVGPNGSGKSNIIDSMLFVFGYRATKIRSKKISSLIHSSIDHPNCNSCKVSIYFKKILDKNDESHEEISNSNLIISRTGFRDNSSFYELNSKKVQFKEISKLLKKEGVDLDYNRFLILQGEVEQIALMKPKSQNENETGMLEFLEDIIGTNRYKEPLQKLIEKIEMLNERVIEKTNRLKIAEKDRDTLKEPMQDAVNYLKIENTITRIQNKLFNCKKIEKIMKINEKEELNKKFENDCNELNENYLKIKKQREELQNELKEKFQKWNEIQNKKDELSLKFDNIRKKDEELHAELVETNKRRKININNVKNENEKINKLSNIPNENNKNIEEYENLIKKYINKKEKEDEILNNLMNSLNEKTKPLIDKRSQLENKLIEHKKLINNSKAIFDLAQSELQIYTSVEETENSKLIKLNEILNKSIETLEDRREKLKNLKIKIPKTEKTLNETRSELEKIKLEESQIIEKLKDKRRNYEEQKLAMNASKSRNNVLNSLMKQKNENKIPGIIGRLGDLGAIDAKYDIAVSTACGPLDYIVVDTVDTAELCIKYLRENDIGRANFIPLEKQNHLIEIYKKKIKIPDNSIRLFDLIKVEDERILSAFYFSLKNTLLTDNLEIGTKIAYGQNERWRVVTLDGQLIETSGTMSGGGKPMKGRIGQKIVRNEPSNDDIKKLSDKLDEIFNKFNELKGKQPKLEDQIKTLSIGLEEMILNRDKYEIEITSIEEQIPLLNKQLKEQEKIIFECKTNPEKVDELKKNVENSKIQFDKIVDNSKSTENDVKEINEKIDEISGGKIKNQQIKISDLSKLIDKTRKEIIKLQVSIKTSERDKEKTYKIIEQLENDIENCKNSIKKIQEEKIKLEDIGHKILNELKIYEEELKERDQDDCEKLLKQKINNFQNNENKIKATKIDIDEKFKLNKNEISELKKKILQYENEINNLKLNNIPNENNEELPKYTEEQILKFDTRTIINNLSTAKQNLPDETPNMQTIKDYLEKDSIFLKKSYELKETTDTRNNMRKIYDEIKKKKTEEFYIGFNVITKKLKEMYQMITLGGAAELEFVDSLDPFTEGITFTVRPPKKSWKNISNLSGGEKTLSSLALVFALHHYKPTPLYFMDEIDAALDFKNVSIVGRYIKERTKNAQFIVISLRSEMFELVDNLIGIYKTFNSTKSVTLDVKKFYKENPILAAREKAKIDEKIAVGRVSLTQAIGRQSGIIVKMPLSCPLLKQKVVDENENHSQADELNMSLISSPSPEKNHERKSVDGGDTPTTTRKSRRLSEE